MQVENQESNICLQHNHLVQRILLMSTTHSTRSSSASTIATHATDIKIIVGDLNTQKQARTRNSKQRKLTNKNGLRLIDFVALKNMANRIGGGVA